MLNIRRLLDSSSFVRFIIVGGSATLLDYVIYWFLSSVINFNVAKTFAITCSCLYSFFLNKKFTFGNKEKTSFNIVFKYVLSQLVNIAANVISNYLVYTVTNNKVLSMVCATGVAMVANYLLQKYFVFNEGSENHALN